MFQPVTGLVSQKISQGAQITRNPAAKNRQPGHITGFIVFRINKPEAYSINLLVNQYRPSVLVKYLIGNFHQAVGRKSLYALENLLLTLITVIV